MWITKFRVTSFNSFADSGWIELNPSANLFIGQNNSGKSALLKAVAPGLSSAPHRSRDAYREGELKPTRVDFDIAITMSELKERFATINQRPTFPGTQSGSTDIINEFLRTTTSLSLEAYRDGGGVVTPREGASLGAFRDPREQIAFNVEERNGIFVVVNRVGGQDNLVSFLDSPTAEAVFYFSAQRINIARSPYGEERQLRSDASNLPSVLAYLQGSRPDVFDLIEQHVAEIVPGVGGISVTPSGGNFEILLWNDRDFARRELAFSLQDSGTGIGQLIAILTAVVTTEQSVVIIDEINTFLHPAAVKKLLLTLRSQYNQHQYIISTHSSDVITSSGAEKIYLVEKDGFRSAVKEVSQKNVSDVRRIGNLLGFSIMDVFGYDRIVWVEGQTEEICIPYLLREFGFEIPSGLGFSAVAATDDFSKRGAATKGIIQLYDHVAKTVSPLLLGMAFGLDRERLSDDAAKALERSKRKLKFLPRRCLECYLLEPKAIAFVIASHLSDNEAVSAQDVEVYLEQQAGDKMYGASGAWEGDLANDTWLKKVDAARLLSDCFGALSDKRVEFRKTRDSFSLLSEIIKTDKDNLDELYEFTKKLIEVAMRESAA